MDEEKERNMTTPNPQGQTTNYNVLDAGHGAFVKAWTRGVPVEGRAEEQLKQVARLPFIHKWVAAMPDVHVGKGATVGSVIPTYGAVIPAAVGVDLGCGMVAVRTTLTSSQLPDSLRGLRTAIEAAVPHGRTGYADPVTDRGAWGNPPLAVAEAWQAIRSGYERIARKHPKIDRGAHVQHLGTLGTGNHFIEVCLDESERVWLMLHSGSRGVGNRIGSYFIELAKEDMRRWFIQLPEVDLAYLPEGTEHFDDYVEAVGWAQDYAALNRRLMMDAVVTALATSAELPPFQLDGEVVNCHYNYVTWRASTTTARTCG
jgi:tRNA-splicing ligase RtcB